MDLTQLPYRPGDLVRNKKTDSDYVIESVTPLVGAGILISAIGLLSDRVDRWKALSIHEMSDTHTRLFSHPDFISAAETREFFNDNLKRAIKGNVDLFNQLEDPENIAFRDLLYMGISSEVSEEKAISSAILNLAETLTTVTNKVIDKDSLVKLFTEHAPSSISPEAIELFANDIVSYAKSKRASNKLLSKSSLESLFLDSKGSINGEIFALFSGNQRRFSQNPKDPRWKYIRGILTGSIIDSEIEKEIFGSPGLGSLGPLERIEAISKRMFLSQSGRENLSEPISQFLNSNNLSKTVLKFLKGKKISNRDPNYTGATLLVDALANWLVGPSMSNTRNQIEKTAGYSIGHVLHHDAGKLSAMNKHRLFSFNERAKKDLYKDYRNQYSRRTGIREARRTTSSFNLYNLGELDQSINTTNVTYHAISKDAFKNTVLSDIRLKLGNVEGTTNQTNVLDALESASYADADPYYVVSTQELRQLKLLRGTTNQTFDLSVIMQEQSARKELIEPKSHLLLHDLILNSNQERGTNFAMPLREANKITGNNVYYLSNSYERIYTADLERAQELLKKSKWDEFGFADLGSSKSNIKLLEEVVKTGDVRSDTSGSTLFSRVSQAVSSKNVSSLYATTEDNIGNLISFLRTNNNEDKMKILKLGKYSHREVSDEYMRGYQTGKLMLANVKHSTGLNKLTWIASEVNVDLSTQLERAKELLKGNGIILDIETRKTANGKHILKEVAFGTSSHQSSFLARDFSSRDKIINSLIEISNKLQNHLESKSVVGTAGPHDFNTLIETTKNLIEEHSKAPGDKAVLQKLERSLEIFTKISKDNLVDIQTIYPFAGYTAGNTSQSFLTSTLLNKTQKHTALQDIIDVFDIFKKIGPTALNNINRSSRKDFFNSNLFYLNKSALTTSGDSRIKRILGVAEYDNKFYLQYRLYNSRKSSNGFSLSPSNVVGQDEFSSIQALAATLEQHSHVFSEEEFNTKQQFGSITESVAERHHRATIDLQERRLRAYNPFTISRWDSLGDWDSSMGDFAASRLELDNRLMTSFPALHQKYMEAIEKIKGKKAVTNQGIMKAMDRFDKIISEELAKTHPDIADKRLGAEFRALAWDILQNQYGTTSSQYLEPDSTLSTTLQSPAYRSLRESARAAIGLGETEISSNPIDYNFKTIFYSAAAASKTKKQLQTVNTLSGHIKESEARMSLAMGLEHTSLKFDKASSTSIETFKNHLRNLASENMLSENSKPLRKVLEQMKISFEDYNDLLEDFKKANSLEEISDNLPVWKKAIEDLGFLDYGDHEHTFKTLLTIRDTLSSSNEKEIYLNSLKEKMSSLQQLIKLENDISSKREYQRQLVQLKRIFDQIKVSNDPTKTISDILSEEDNSLMAAFRDKRIEAPSLSILTQEEVEQIDKSIFEDKGMLSKLNSILLENNSDDVTMEEVMADISLHTSLRQGTFNTLDSMQAGKSRLREILTLHEQGISLRTILSRRRNDPIKFIHQAVQEGTTAGNAANQAVGSSVRAVSELVLQNGTIGSPSSIYSKVSVPLLAIGGLVGLLGAVKPNLETPTSQMSKRISSQFNGNENNIAKFSEIPGDPDQQQIWYGSSSPFQLDITFNGFINDKSHHNRLRSEILNIINSNMEIVKTTGGVRDERNKSHRIPAIDALRGHF